MHGKQEGACSFRELYIGKINVKGLRLIIIMHKATQTQLLVSRLLPAKRGCGRAVIIHYSLLATTQ